MRLSFEINRELQGARAKVRQKSLQIQTAVNPEFLEYSSEILIGYWTMHWPYKQTKITVSTPWVLQTNA